MLPQVASIPSAPPNIQLPSEMEVKARPTALWDLSLRFLENLKARFGEQSIQSHDVHETLGAFKRGELSKRKVHATILDTLEGHDDLRQELMDIFIHPEARWAPGDFDLPTEQQTQPHLETFPRLLQSTHQPQMRLPSISSNWFPLPQADQTIGSGMFGVHNGHYSENSSPALPVLAPFQRPNPTTQLWPDQNVKATYAAVDDGLVPPPIRTAFRNPWEETANTGAWACNELSLPPDGMHVDELCQDYGSPALAFTDRVQPSVMHLEDAPSNLRPGLFQQETSQFLLSPQPSYGIPPLPTNNHSSYSTLDEQYIADAHAPLTPVSESPPGLQKIEEHAEEQTEETGVDTTIKRSYSRGGPFIHNLCGKGFATQLKVKKHHWGKKNNDLATKTGCWAKHNKPNVAWDSHPSCKERRSTSETNKSVLPSSRRTQTKAIISRPDLQANLELTQQNTVPGFPKLEDLPHRVSTSLSRGAETMSSPQEKEHRYRNNQLPSRSSFDNLLTAVNVAAQIDAPKPQGRTDSIALHLDTQLARGEHHRQHAPFVPFRPLTSTFDARFERPVVPTALDTTASSRHTLSAPQLHNESKEAALEVPSDVKGSHADAACSQPFKFVGTHLSGPTSKKRKV